MEPIIWLGVLAVLLVIEGLTTALTTIWFAGGALAAAIAAGIGMGIVPQLLLFFCVSLVLLFFTRPAALKLMRKDTEKTNPECGRSAHGPEPPRNKSAPHPASFYLPSEQW